jgi:hypothetical protein
LKRESWYKAHQAEVDRSLWERCAMQERKRWMVQYKQDLSLILQGGVEALVAARHARVMPHPRLIPFSGSLTFEWANQRFRNLRYIVEYLSND